MSYKTKKRNNKKGGNLSKFKDFFNKGKEFATRKKDGFKESLIRRKNSLSNDINTFKAVLKMPKEDRKRYFEEKKKFDKGINFDENCKNLDKCETDIVSFLKSFEDDRCPLFYKKLKNLFDCYNSDPNNMDDQIDMVVQSEDEYNDGTNLPDNLTELIQKAVDWAKAKEGRATIYSMNDYDANYIPDEEISFTSNIGGKRSKKRRRKTKLKKTRKSMKKRK
jgi:hypothetical protein